MSIPWHAPGVRCGLNAGLAVAGNGGGTMFGWLST